MKVKIVDVAREANVSVATVSRVVNNIPLYLLSVLCRSVFCAYVPPPSSRSHMLIFAPPVFYTVSLDRKSVV